MKFRPCIDIHNGLVKQIIGSSLTDEHDQASENYVSQKDASWYASLYRQENLKGGHVILLNPASSPYYEADVAQARSALKTYEGGLQIGGGMNDENAQSFLDCGASHVIVTSFVFQNGEIHMDHLKKLSQTIGPKHLVLDLSCRRRKNPGQNAGSKNVSNEDSEDSTYYIVTDRWQNYTNVPICEETFALLEPYCDEFLIHAVDVEGKNAGIETDLVSLLSHITALPITYAGGIHSLSDIDTIRKLGEGNIDFTVGSALDLFGGQLSFQKLCELSNADPK